jgi:hypothetical protein
VASLESHPSKLADFDSGSLETNMNLNSKNGKSLQKTQKKNENFELPNSNVPFSESQVLSRQRSISTGGISMQAYLPTESPSMLRNTFAARSAFATKADLDSSTSSDTNYYKTCEELCLEIDDALAAVRSNDSNIGSDEKPKFKEVRPSSTSNAVGTSDEMKHALSSSSASTISSFFKDNAA